MPSSTRLKLLGSVGLMAIPYVLLTLHYSTPRTPTTRGLLSRSRAAPDLLRSIKKTELAAYWAVIDEAQRVLDSLNASSAPREPSRRNLVLGLAEAVPTTNLAVFVGSLKKHAPGVDVVLFVDAASYDAELQTVLASVTVRVFERDKLEPPHLRAYHPSTFRWPLASEYLNARGSATGAVLFADVRDTAFQSDPFAGLVPERFYAFHGVESRTIGQCGWNGGWIRDCFGDKKVASLSAKPILCSGVSIGSSFELARRYAAQMAAVVSHPDFARCERNGVDQGVHNVLVHDGKVEGSVVVPQRNSRVANLQAKVALVQSSAVLRASDRTPVAVVHQYDRYPDLANFYYKTYANDQQRSRGIQSDACAAYDIKSDVDLFKAKCDLSATSGTNVQDCCKACTRARDCAAWTLAGSLCYLKTCARPATNVRMPGASSGLLLSTPARRR